MIKMDLWLLIIPEYFNEFLGFYFYYYYNLTGIDAGS
jgi:hypothetical protein